MSSFFEYYWNRGIVFRKYEDAQAGMKEGYTGQHMVNLRAYWLRLIWAPSNEVLGMTTYAIVQAGYVWHSWLWKFPCKDLPNFYTLIYSIFRKLHSCIPIRLWRREKTREEPHWKQCLTKHVPALDRTLAFIFIFLKKTNGKQTRWVFGVGCRRKAGGIADKTQSQLQNGNNECTGELRARELPTCPMAAFAMFFVYRWDMVNKDKLDFSYWLSWYEVLFFFTFFEYFC